MSLFGPTDDTDLRRWQERNLKGLTELVQLGAKKELPPLFWTLPDLGDIAGKFSVQGRGHDPRAVFELWFEALSGHLRVAPRGSGLRGEGPPRAEKTFDSGRTRLWAGFTLQIPEGKCNVALIAEWFAEDLAKIGEQPQ